MEENKIDLTLYELEHGLPTLKPFIEAAIRALGRDATVESVWKWLEENRLEFKAMKPEM